MNSRLESLVKRGYPEDVVKRLSSYTDEELDYACNKAFEHLSKDCVKVDSPSAIFIGGQPGSGKTILSMELKNKIKNAIEIGIDNYRAYHPHYLEIEKCIKEFWKNREETENDSKGNDLADFTHSFAGAMSDRLIELAANSSYNILLEWGMREPTAPLSCMKYLKSKTYNNTVVFVCTNKKISYDACKLRAGVMNNSVHIIRNVPKYFHDYCVETLPDSLSKIYNEGFKLNLIDYMAIINRNGKVIWDDKSKVNPKEIYINHLNNVSYEDINHAELSIIGNINEMQGLDDNNIMSVIPTIFNNGVKSK